MMFLLFFLKFQQKRSRPARPRRPSCGLWGPKWFKILANQELVVQLVGERRLRVNGGQR